MSVLQDEVLLLMPLVYAAPGTLSGVSLIPSSSPLILVVVFTKRLVREGSFSLLIDTLLLLLELVLLVVESSTRVTSTGESCIIFAIL